MGIKGSSTSANNMNVGQTSDSGGVIFLDQSWTKKKKNTEVLIAKECNYMMEKSNKTMSVLN